MYASQILSAGKKLYLICDGETCAARGISLTDFVMGAARGGAKTIQYRHKNISAAVYAENTAPLAKIAAAAHATLIVNDHAELAEQFQLPLHLGQEDTVPQQLSVPYGRSTHSLAELEIALRAIPGPDYIALGTMFPSTTKTGVATNQHLVAEYIRLTPLPLVLIGGITLDNVADLPRSESIYYAVIGDAFRFGATAADIEKYTRLWLPPTGQSQPDCQTSKSANIFFCSAANGISRDGTLS